MKLTSKMISIVALAVLVCESVVMLLLHQMGTIDGHLSHVLIDSFALVFCLSPILYIFVYKPLNYHSKKLTEQDNNYRALVEESEDLITHVNGESLFTFVNSASTKILGLSPEECLGLTAFDFLHPEDRARTKNWFEKCLASKRRRGTIENQQINCTTGNSHSVLWSVSFEYDASGVPIGVGGIARDLSPIRSAEQKFQNLFEQMLDGFALHEMIYNAEGTPVELTCARSFERKKALDIYVPPGLQEEFHSCLCY